MPECRSCGADNSDEFNFCSYCGSVLPKPVEPPPSRQVYRTAYEQDQRAQTPGSTGQAQIKNWLVESILVTVLCCLPLGIGGILNAIKVDKLAADGDIHGARSASTNAMWFVIVGAILGLVTTAFYFAVQTMDHR
jgi:hypothetical protein